MEPKDWIALVTVVGGLILIALEKDSFVGWIMISIIAYYFGMSHIERRNRRTD